MREYVACMPSCPAGLVVWTAGNVPSACVARRRMAAGDLPRHQASGVLLHDDLSPEGDGRDLDGNLCWEGLHSSDTAAAPPFATQAEVGGVVHTLGLRHRMGCARRGNFCVLTMMGDEFRGNARPRRTFRPHRA